MNVVSGVVNKRDLALLKETLDESRELILGGRESEGFSLFERLLEKTREETNDDVWDSLVRYIVISHPLQLLLMKDPFVYRSFVKPRGYAGDAVMIDYTYFNRPPEMTQELGRRLFHITTNVPSALSVKERREQMARRIDEHSEKLGRKLRVFSVACGHLREVEISEAFQQHRIAEAVALDQDDRSLELVRSCYGSFPITCVNRSIQQLLVERTDLGEFDLIWSAGLYDYLPESVGQMLTQYLFGRLRIGGKLILANFAPDNANRGSMESFMDWKLILRDEAAMERLIKDLPEASLANREVYRDSHRNIIFLEVHRS